MEPFYVYNEFGENIACVYALDINEAYEEASYVTGLKKEKLSVERA